VAAENIFQKQNYGARTGFGTSPALLIVDFTNGFKDPAVLGHPEIAKAMSSTRSLLDASRAARIPVAYTRHLYADDGSDLGRMKYKVRHQTILTEDHPSSQIG
jgi:maleamate amidohydrolase